MIRVWVTRDEPRDGPLGMALREAGLEPVHEPVIKRIQRSDGRDELSQLGPGDVLVLTSAFAVKCLATDAIRRDSPPRIVTVGEATAEAARRAGLRAEFDAQATGAANLFDRLRHQLTHGTVCYPRSLLTEPPSSWAEVTIIAPVLYDTTRRNVDRAILQRVDIAAVTSPSAAGAIGRIDLPLASIGPTTTMAIRELGISPLTEAETPSFTALAGAIAAVRERLERSP